MRHPVFLSLPLFALAACGGGGGNAARPGTEAWARNVIGNEGYANFERPDGTFDRADYRRIMVPGCVSGVRDGNASIPADRANAFCACLVERMLTTHSDDQLRAMRGNVGLETRAFDQATPSCLPLMGGGAAAPGPDASGPLPVGDEPPPPEPPPPSQQSGTPPPVVQDPPPRR
jgi:hypothetical protein